MPPMKHGHTTSHTRAAIIISIMAAVLAITEFAAKDASSSYLTHHIGASDTWAQYQAKSVPADDFNRPSRASCKACPGPAVLRCRSASPMPGPMRSECVQNQAPMAWSSSPKRLMNKSTSATTRCTVTTCWK